MKHRTIDSPAGRLMLSAHEGKLCEVRLAFGVEYMNDCDPVLDETASQIERYFSGELTAFDLPMQLQGSVFDCAVWQKLLEIPFGETRTYGQLAAGLGKPKASRAVGGACSRNPLLIVVPCHRVIAGTGKLTGFAAGLAAKRALLEHEGWTILGDRVKTEDREN